MKETTNQNKAYPERERMLALYDNAPYPEVLEGRVPQNSPLLTHWINAVTGTDKIALGSGGNLLVAGCGSGAEAFMLAELFPQATVLGVDFSARSIERAKEKAKSATLSNLSFEVADLMSPDWTKAHAPFDFILCYGVADYVLDPALLMQNLAACLSENGVICMTVNSPHHPAGRIRTAFAALGIAPEAFEDSPDRRALLQLLDQLMGTDAKLLGLGNAPSAYLNVDIFAPIAHHDSIEDWCARAQAAGLSFSGSMDAPLGLLQVTDAQLPLLYALNKADLSLWMAKLYQRPGMQLLFSRQAAAAPDFMDLESLWDWKPRLDSCLGLLPDLEGDPNEPRMLTLRFDGLPDFVLQTTAYDLAVLRRCDGRHRLAEIMAMIPAEGDLASLRACLYRGYQYGLLST